MGTPAKIVRDINGEDLKALKANADRYIEYARRYLSELGAIGQQV
jgi:carbonic anhydrase/acetyltransferase-like protein (isoleucine patch superfamily)